MTTPTAAALASRVVSSRASFTPRAERSAICATRSPERTSSAPCMALVRIGKRSTSSSPDVMRRKDTTHTSSTVIPPAAT